MRERGREGGRRKTWSAGARGMAYLAEEIMHSKPWVQDTGMATSRQLGKVEAMRGCRGVRIPNLRACNLGGSMVFTLEKWVPNRRFLRRSEPWLGLV